MYSKDSKPYIISIAGTTHGCGVTHLCAEITTYISKVLKRKVALIELGDCKRLGFLYHNGSKIHKNMTLIKNGTQSNISSLLASDYEYFVLDLGCNLGKFESEYSMSDLRIMMLNISKHMMSETFAKLGGEPYSKLVESSILTYSFGSRHDADILRKIFKKEITRFPYEEEILKLNSKNLSFYGSLMDHIKK